MKQEATPQLHICAEASQDLDVNMKFVEKYAGRGSHFIIVAFGTTTSAGCIF